MQYDYRLMGGVAIDATGVPLPKETVDACKAADCVFLGAVGGPKWDTQPGNNRPEAGPVGHSRAHTRYLRVFAPRHHF